MDAAPAPGARRGAVISALGVAVLVGFFGLPIAFLFAYAFSDEVTAAHHLVFLVMVLALTVFAALIAWPILAAALRYGAARGLAGALAVVSATYTAALGVGTVVSLLNEDQGSVTADQPDAPFLVLLACCALVVAVGGVGAARALRTELPGQESNLRR